MSLWMLLGVLISLGLDERSRFYFLGHRGWRHSWFLAFGDTDLSLVHWPVYLLTFDHRLITGFVLACCLMWLCALIGDLRHEVRLASPTGKCHVCGYDLRATPKRCPQCGTVSSLGRY